MSEPKRLYKAILWVSEKGLKDIAQLQLRFTLFMRSLLAKAEPERFKYEMALGEQWEDLVELDLLKSTLAVKQIAEQQGGFSEEHGPALETAANALYEHCGWDDEDITDWFGSLVMGDNGAHLGIDIVEEEDDEP